MMQEFCRLLGHALDGQFSVRGFYPKSDVRAEKDNGKHRDGSFKYCQKAAIAMQKEGRGIYLVVNGPGRKDAEIVQCRAVFYEHDNLDPEISSTLWQSLGLPQPSFQVDTGSKSIHSYWVLIEPIGLDLWRSLQSDLIEFADADRKNKNPSRVMRLPGFTHPETGRVAKIINATEHRYSFDELRALVPVVEREPARGALPPAPRIEPKEGELSLVSLLAKINRPILDGVLEGSRNGDLHRLGMDLAGVEQWLSLEGVPACDRAEDLFLAACGRCSPPMGALADDPDPLKFWARICKESNGPCLSDDKLRNILRAREKKLAVKEAPVVKAHVESTEGKPTKLTHDQLIEVVRSLEIKHGFLTSQYFWALEELADQLKRSARFLQTIYTKSLSQSCDLSDRTFAEACKAAPADVPWIIPGLLYRGSTTLFHAGGGTGKTLLMYSLIKAVNQSGAFLGQQVTEQVTCGLIQVDEPELPFIERMKDLGLDESDNRVILDWSFGQVSTLDQWILEHDLGVVIIDSFFAAQKFAETRENDADHAAILMRLRDIAQRTHCAIVIIHHSNKQGGARGTSAITGAVSEVWHLTAPDPEKHRQYCLKPAERIFQSEKTRMCGIFKMGLAFDGDTLEWRNLGDLTKIDDGTIDQPATWAERIKAFAQASSEPFTVSDLLGDRTMLGLERETAKKTLARLKKKGFIDSDQGGGKTETEWFKPGFRKKIKNTCPGVPVQPETPASSSFEYRDINRETSGTAQDLERSVPIASNRDTSDCPDCVPVDVPALNPLPGEDSSLNRDSGTGENEIFSRRQSEEREKQTKASAHKPRRPYSGPAVGSFVWFEDQGLTEADHKRMRSQGTEYPWGQCGFVTEIVQGTNRHEIIVTVADRTYLVDNFLAIEVLETPEERAAMRSESTAWDPTLEQGELL
jgi:hypothetical protein